MISSRAILFPILVGLPFIRAAERPSTLAPVVQLSPSPVVGGNKVSGSVILPLPAPPRGTTVTVTTSSVGIAPLQDASGAPAGPSPVQLLKRAAIPDKTVRMAHVAAG